MTLFQEVNIKKKKKRELTKLTVEENSGNLAVTEYCNLAHDIFGL